MYVSDILKKMYEFVPIWSTTMFLSEFAPFMPNLREEVKMGGGAIPTPLAATDNLYVYDVSH